MAYRTRQLSDEDIANLHIKDMETDKLEKALAFINSLKAWRRQEKLYSTYIKGTKKAVDNTKTSRVYFDYRLEGTVTGRLSCGALKAKVRPVSKTGKVLISKEHPLGVSFHTLPRDSKKEKDTSIRQLFEAEPNEHFITADFKAMELRILAHVADESNMIRAFFSGEDLHKYTASLIYNKSIADVTPEERQTAKSVSFLVVYGGGAWKLSRTANVSLAVAEATIERFREVYPRVFEWMEDVKEDLRKNKHVRSIFGRQRHLPDVDSSVQKIQDKAYRQAINYIIQSSASDVVCYCVLDIYKELKLRNLTSRIIGSVHDSIEVSSPSDELEETLQIMYNKMTTYPTMKADGYILKVPIEVEVEVGRSFSGEKEVKYSKAGAIINMKDILYANT
jgi:DNA polymerase-1